MSSFVIETAAGTFDPDSKSDEMLFNEAMVQRSVAAVTTHRLAEFAGPVLILHFRDHLIQRQFFKLETTAHLIQLSSRV